MTGVPGACLSSLLLHVHHHTGAIKPVKYPPSASGFCQIALALSRSPAVGRGFHTTGRGPAPTAGGSVPCALELPARVCPGRGGAEGKCLPPTHPPGLACKTRDGLNALGCCVRGCVCCSWCCGGGGVFFSFQKENNNTKASSMPLFQGCYSPAAGWHLSILSQQL